MQINNPKSNRTNSFNTLVYNDIRFRRANELKDNLPKFPFLVDIELTNHCNLSCIFCGQQTMSREKGFMSEQTFKQVIDECSLRKTPIRLIRWGEPFLHPQIIEFCKYAKSKDLLVHITNNGQMITEQQIRSLIDLNVDSIVFSFQGATKEEYRIMRNNDKYDKLAQSVQTMASMRGNSDKPYMHISTTVTNETGAQIEQFTSYWSNIVDSVGVGKTNLFRLAPSQIKSFQSLNMLLEVQQTSKVAKQYRPCTEVYQKLSVNWDGSVSCCCGDYDNFMTVGHLKNQTLEDIWKNSENLKIFRKLLDNKQHNTLNLCSTCYHTYDEF